MSKITGIVAVDAEWGIGKDGTLPWKCSEDLKNFKEITSGGIVVMGRKCLDSLPNGKPLPNRVNVVLTRKYPQNPVEGVIYCTDYRKVLEFSEKYDKEVFIIGGAEIYKLFEPHYTEIYETQIEGTFDCDTFWKGLRNLSLSEKFRSNVYRLVKWQGLSVWFIKKSRV